MSPDDLNASANTQTESHDSVLVEFTDLELQNAPLTEHMLNQLRQHLPSWLRERLPPSANAHFGSNSAALAACLLTQARVLSTLQRYPEALSKVTEAEHLYQTAKMPLCIADCYHTAAKIHESLGEPDKAIDFLRREEELRRRLAA